MTKEDELHLFIYIARAERLHTLQMRHIFAYLQLHPSIEHVFCGSIWCNRLVLQFDMAFDFPLSAFSPIEPTELDLKFLLRAAQNSTSKPIAHALLPIKQQNAKMRPVSICDSLDGSVLGSLFVTFVIGPQSIQGDVAPEQFFKKPQLSFLFEMERFDWKNEARGHNWRSIQYIEQNWENLALHFGWTPPKPSKFVISQGDSLTLEIESIPVGFCDAILAGVDSAPQNFEARPRLVRISPRRRLATSIEARRTTLYSLIRALGLSPDFGERSSDFRSLRCERNPGFFTEAGPHDSDRSDVSDEIDRLIQAPIQPKFSLQSHNIFETDPTIPTRVFTQMESIDIAGRPPIMKSPSLEEILDKGVIQFTIDLSDSAEEDI
jgi:hypothetical protein